MRTIAQAMLMALAGTIGACAGSVPVPHEPAAIRHEQPRPPVEPVDCEHPQTRMDEWVCSVLRSKLMQERAQ